MRGLLNCMFDTVVFNRILDGILPFDTLSGCVTAYATHIQRDELNSTKDLARRAGLAQVFSEVIAGRLPTSSAVLGVSRLGEARLSGNRVLPTASAVYGVSTFGEARYCAAENLYSTLRGRLDSLNRSKPNNTQDALIAETAIVEGHVLVTDDAHLATVTKECGGQALSVQELLSHCTNSPAT